MYISQPTPSPKLGTILLLGSLTAFGAISIDLYLPGLPAIGVSLGADAASVQHTLSAFFIGMGLGQLFYGPLSDRFGRRRPLLIGVAIYVAASLACAAAPTIDWLVGARFLQALGACAGVTVARAVVRDRYGHRESARIFSLLVLVLAVAPLLAPTVGAWLLTFASWRVLFLLLAVFGAIVGTAVAFRLDESRSPATEAYARGESVAASYLGLLRTRRLLGYTLVGAFNGAVIFTYISGAADLLITSYGFSPGEFGIAFSVISLGVIGSSQVNRMLLATFTPDRILAVTSLAGAGIGAALLAAAAAGAGPWVMLPVLFAALGTFGLTGSNTLAGALSVDPQRAGATSALVGAASFIVGALASAVAAALHDGTAAPMASVMAVALIASTMALFTLVLPLRSVRPG